LLHLKSAFTLFSLPEGGEYFACQTF
jgi:hypothetical protein